MTASRQLALPLEPTPSYAQADFHPTAGSQAARDWLAKPTLWAQGRLVLWGESGCGKTHLLNVWAAGCGAARFSGPALRALPAAISGPVAIDDADLVADETLLFHLLNIAAASGQPVLLAARLPPSRQAIGLADLASRLRASLAVEIAPPDDAEQATLLTRLAAQRQLILNPQVCQYLLTHLPRTPAALIEAIARLDRAALAHGSKISRQLAAQLLDDLANPGPTA